MSKIEKIVTIQNKKGLHARPAALFVQLVEKCNVNATVTKGSEKVNGKSIMGLLMLGAQCGSTLTLAVEGEGAEAAMVEFEHFFSSQEENLSS